MDNEISKNDSAEQAEGNGRKGISVKRDIKGYILFFAAMLIVAVIVICILTLLPKKNPRLKTDGDNGLGRSFVYPFVFLDKNDNLFILENNSALPAAIDDTVSDAVHVTGTGTVLYTRQSDLYEYGISSKRRRMIYGGIASFSMTGDGTTVAFSCTDNSLRVAQGKNVSELLPPGGSTPENYYVTGTSCILFLSNFDPDAGTASLNLYNTAGSVTVIAENISPYQPYGFSGGDKYVYCCRENDLLILDRKGGVITEIENGSVVTPTKQPSIYDNSTSVRKFDANVPISYIYTANVQSQLKLKAASPTAKPQTSSGSLLFFNGKTVKTVAEDVRRGIYASPDHSLVIYSIPDGNGERICRADKNGRVEELVHVEELQRCLYDTETYNLYFQTRDGHLYRFNIYSSKPEPALISEVSANIYKYPEKPFVLFSIPDSDMICMIRNTGAVEQFKADEQIRLYGADKDKYLLLRGYGYGSISLDLVDGEYIKRISSSVDPNVIFDSLIKNVIFVSDGTLCIWDGNAVTEAGSFGQIRSVDIA